MFAERFYLISVCSFVCNSTKITSQGKKSRHSRFQFTFLINAPPPQPHTYECASCILKGQQLSPKNQGCCASLGTADAWHLQRKTENRHVHCTSSQNKITTLPYDQDTTTPRSKTLMFSTRKSSWLILTFSRSQVSDNGTERSSGLWALS